MARDRHGLETESAIKLDLVQTKRKKGRGRRNKAAVRTDTKCEQQVLMDVFDDLCDTPRDVDVAMDHSSVGCSSAVLEPGEHDWTSRVNMPDDLDGVRWSSSDKGGAGGRTHGFTHSRHFTWGKRPQGWQYDDNSRASKGYNGKCWYDSGRVAMEQWRSGRPGNLMEGVGSAQTANATDVI